MTDHDVAIVGAGPTGLLLACLLAQDGVEVAVYEQRATSGSQSRAVGILAPGVRALRRAGLEQAVRAEALPVAGGVARSRGRALAAVPLGSPGAGDGVLTLPQQRLDVLLRRRLADLAPRALRSGVSVERVQDGSEAALLHLRRSDEVRVVTARLVVAADGVRSAIRARLGIRWRRCGRAVRYLMMDLDDDTTLGAWAQLFLEPGGVVESFPLPGRRRRWVVRDRALGEDACAFADIVRQRTGYAITPDLSRRPTAFLARQHRADTLVKGRIVLLGDAAHEISPIGGQGLNLGWAGALRLAAAISASPRGTPPDLRRYAREQQRAARRARGRARFNMTMGHPVTGPVRVARDLLSRALGMPPLRGIAVRVFTMHDL